MSISSISGAVSTYAALSGQVAAGPGTESAAAQSSYSQTIDTDSLTVLSLNRNLSTQADKTQNDLLAQGLAQAIDAATIVDPVTGHRELVAGATKSLATAITNLLTQNGFSQDVATAATAVLTKELAQGGKASLTLGSDISVTNGEAALLSTGSGTAAAARITSSEYSSRITIGIDLDSGTLGIATQAESNFATASEAAVVDDGADGFTGGAQGTAGGTAQYLAASSGSSIQAFLNPAKAKESPFQQLLETLFKPTLAKADAAGKAVQHLSRIAQGTADATTPFPGITLTPDGKAQTHIDLHTPVALRNTDRHGHGSTLYRRPDGSLGAFTLKPTNLTA